MKKSNIFSDEYLVDITPKDLEKSVRFHSRNFITQDNLELKAIYEKQMQILFENESDVKSDIKEYTKNYKNLDKILNSINFDFRELLITHNNYDGDFMKIYVYHSRTRNKQNNKCISFDGEYKTYFSDYHKEQFNRLYALDPKRFRKLMDESLSEYFPYWGYTALGYGEKFGYKSIIDSVKNYVSRHKEEIEPFTEFEARMFENCFFKEYINACKNVWENQEEAKKFIKEHIDSTTGEFINFEEDLEKDVNSSLQVVNQSGNISVLDKENNNNKESKYIINNTNTLMLPTSNYPINKPEIEIVETSTYIPPEIPIFVVPKDEKIEKEVEEAYQRCKTDDEFFEWLKNN